MRITVGIAIAAILVLLASVIPSPYVVERPGPVLDTLGEVPVDSGGDDGATAGEQAGDAEAEPLISIDGAETYPTTGSLSLTTVTLIGSPEHPVKWISLVPALLDADQRISPRSEFFPEGVSSEQRSEVNEVLLGSSQSQAAVAAARETGWEVPATVMVAQVAEEGPAAGELEPEDELLAVDGEPVTSVTGLRDVVGETPAGEAVSLEIVRDGERREVSVTPAVPEGGGQPLLGITAGTDYEMPFEVEMSLEDIGGPSAGMVFALAITDMLTPDDLVAGMHVAGTGTIDDTGRVGEIGGLAQKIAGAADDGAELFLMPVGNCGDLPERLPGSMEIAPVETLDEAISAVEATGSGGAVPGVERCEATER